MTLDEIRALCEAASPGPWSIRHAPHEKDYSTIRDRFDYEVACSTAEGYEDANARLIAAARTLLPALLEVAKEADKLLEIAPTVEKRALRDALAALEDIKLP